jgi:hypothetical protein
MSRNINFGTFEKAIYDFMITRVDHLDFKTLQEYFLKEDAAGWARFLDNVVYKGDDADLMMSPQLAFPEGYNLSSKIVPLPSSGNNRLVKLGTLVLRTAWGAGFFPKVYEVTDPDPATPKTDVSAQPARGQGRGWFRSFSWGQRNLPSERVSPERTDRHRRGVPRETSDDELGPSNILFKLERFPAWALASSPVTLRALKQALQLLTLENPASGTEWTGDESLKDLVARVQAALDALPGDSLIHVKFDKGLTFAPVPLDAVGSGLTLVQILDLIEEQIGARWYWRGENAHIGFDPGSSRFCDRCGRSSTDLSWRGDLDALSIVEP